MSVTIRNDDEGQLDEVLVKDAASAHLRRVDAHLWRLRITSRDGELLNIHISTPRATPIGITGTVERER